MDAGDFADIITAVAAVGAVWVSIRNSAHIKKVERATNGLTVALGEAKLAQGTAQGKAAGLEQGRAEAAGHSTEGAER